MAVRWFLSALLETFIVGTLVIVTVIYRTSVLIKQNDLRELVIYLL